MKIYSTLSAKKEEFKPQGEEVKMYVCGVTPYDEAHIGHAMSYINFDVIRRYLKFRGYKVKYVQNITDIDDKIIQRAIKAGISTAELSGRYEKSFFEDMDALNIMRPDITPRATGEVDKILEVVTGLVDKGFAYEAGGSVYFRVAKLPDYGKLAHRNPDSLIAGARIEATAEKENAADFVLWKASKPGEPSWESPWGQGRPGWHIECSAMALKYLGETIDIHGGGHDLVFPHHENEIAQSESFTGQKPFARHWLHNGLLQLGGEKMSKSLGNLITIKEALAKYGTDAVRIFVLSSHYRRPLTFSNEVLEAAQKGAERLWQAVTAKGGSKQFDWGGVLADCRRKFTESMDDDFNSAKALATLFDLAHTINRQASEGADITPALAVLNELAGVLGLTLKEPEEAPLDEETASLVKEREAMRAAKKWQEADELRAKLEDMGVFLEDTPEGTIWRRRR